MDRAPRPTGLLWNLWYLAVGLVAGAAIATIVALPHLIHCAKG